MAPGVTDLPLKAASKSAAERNGQSVEVGISVVGELSDDAEAWIGRCRRQSRKAVRISRGASRAI